MNKTNIIQQLRRAFFALTIVGALFTLPSAEAGPPVPVSGTFTSCAGVPTVTQVGPNLIITDDGIDTYTLATSAPFDGTAVRTEHDVVFPDGSAATRATIVFTGSVSGRSGTFVMTEAGNVSASGVLNVHWVIDQGTGDLAGLHGNGTGCCVIPLDPDGCYVKVMASYSGQIQFAP